jgi:hypothetical protein
LFSLKKIGIVLTLFGIVAVAAMRTIQFAFFFDGDSGFFTDNGIVSWAALGLGAVAVLCAFLAAYGQGCRYGQYQARRNPLLGVIGLAAGLVLLFCGVVFLMEWKSQEALGVEEVSAIGISMRLPFIGATLLFGIFMIIGGIVAFGGSSFFSRHGLVHLLSVLWGIFLILFIFIHYTISVLMTENLLAMLTGVLLTLAYMNISKFVSGIQAENKGMGGLLLSCCGASVISLGWSLSSLVKYILGIHAKGDVPLLLTVVVLAAGLYVLIFLGSFSYQELPPPEKENAGGKRFRKRIAR